MTLKMSEQNLKMQEVSYEYDKTYQCLEDKELQLESVNTENAQLKEAIEDLMDKVQGQRQVFREKHDGEKALLNSCLQNFELLTKMQFSTFEHQVLSKVES